ncbi:transcription factor IIIB 50 kDa subunit-like [Argopecten irradians]|uniref:transcription factor IIIB 50 kDa subunit-like n=1 Tax=Argopecten irradians TaxID=31199 RepID=UPI0037101132
MSDKTCTVCGENSIVQEAEGAVCMNCGTVQSEQSNFVSDAGDVGYQDPVYLHSVLPSHARQLKAKREQPIIKTCRKKLQYLCVKLSFRPEMVEAANSLFQRALQYKEFRHMLTYNKHILSHCCVYITGRQFNFPITIKEFCAITRQSVSDVARLHKRLISKLEIDIQYQSIASLITYHLSNPVFNRECHDMVKDIVKLYERRSKSNSPHRDVIIGLAAYLSWGSMNLIEYSKTKLTQFAKKHKFIYTAVWRERFKELNDILTDVGSRLPWITTTATPNFTVKHLKDILRFQNSLLLKEMLQNDCEIEEDESDNQNEEVQELNKEDCDGENAEENSQECMYILDDNDKSDKHEKNVGQPVSKRDGSDSVGLESADPKNVNFTELAGKTFVYHSTFRVITADLPQDGKK